MEAPIVAMSADPVQIARNLEAKAPVRLREELAEGYRRMICAETHALVDQARARFAKK